MYYHRLSIFLAVICSPVVFQGCLRLDEISGQHSQDTEVVSSHHTCNDNKMSESDDPPTSVEEKLSLPVSDEIVEEFIREFDIRYHQPFEEIENRPEEAAWGYWLVRFWRTYMLLAMQRPDIAIREMEKSCRDIEKNYMTAMDYVLLGYLYLGSGCFVNAIQAFDKASENNNAEGCHEALCKIIEFSRVSAGIFSHIGLRQNELATNTFQQFKRMLAENKLIEDIEWKRQLDAIETFLSSPEGLYRLVVFNTPWDGSPLPEIVGVEWGTKVVMPFYAYFERNEQVAEALEIDRTLYPAKIPAVWGNMDLSIDFPQSEKDEANSKTGQK